MIQIITSDINKYKNYSNKMFKISNLTEIQALDDFEICIIDLNCETIWENDGEDLTEINCINDLRTIRTAIMNSKNTNIIIVFPQNQIYKYSYDITDSLTYNKDYTKFIKIKDNQDNIRDMISRELVFLGDININYEKTITRIGSNDISSYFYFWNINESNEMIITTSKKSNKITTLKIDNVIMTTLDLLKDENVLNTFIIECCMIKKKEKNIPEWIKDIKILNDKQLEEEKRNNISEIQSLTEKNEKIDEELDQNLEYKSILYSTGNELVKVVLKMLDEILKNDSSTFVDEKKEDFLIKKDDVTFIGEIKGVNTSVNNGNVAQLDNHVQNYIDSLDLKGVKENVKGVLIINHQRTKPLEERQEVHEHQIKLATRNCALIIESQTLLNIYESYRLKKITGEEIKNIFKNEIGLLKFE